jgi:hypothetical protein
MLSRREERILKNANILRQKEHRLRPSLRLGTIREAEKFVHNRGLVSVLGGNELPSIISAFLGREWKPTGKGFTSWNEWWSLKISGQNLGNALAQIDRAKGVVSTRIFRKSKTLVSQKLWPILQPIVAYHSDLASRHEILSQPDWRILQFIQDNGPTRTDHLRRDLNLGGKSNTTRFHSSLSRLESYALIIGHEDPHPEKHMHANIWRAWGAVVGRNVNHEGFSYQDAVEELLSRTMDAVILAPEKEVEKWFRWQQPCLEAKEKLLDSGSILQAGNFLVTPRAA